MMHFVRIFSIMRNQGVRVIATEEFRSYRKNCIGLTSKTLLKMAGRRMHAPHSFYFPGSAPGHKL